ncbi:Uncharacterised protein [uncultured archaeon]|nr:Uncharacterised protein [uncultured archaeon]
MFFFSLIKSAGCVTLVVVAAPVCSLIVRVEVAPLIASVWRLYHCLPICTALLAVFTVNAVPAVSGSPATVVVPTV